MALLGQAPQGFHKGQLDQTVMNHRWTQIKELEGKNRELSVRLARNVRAEHPENGRVFWNSMTRLDSSASICVHLCSSVFICVHLRFKIQMELSQGFKVGRGIDGTMFEEGNGLKNVDSPGRNANFAGFCPED
jgi:hypothetical protein